MIIHFKLLYFLLFQVCFCQNFTDKNGSKFGERSKILSRKKRFLIFPEGSSVQIVFCLTYPTVFNIGEIFLFGNTAALAWELPQDPYSPYRHHADPLHRKADRGTVDNGRKIYKRLHKKKTILNPVFGKRSINQPSKSHAIGMKKVAIRPKLDYILMHAEHAKRDVFKSELMDARILLYHRSSRVGLYEKIENLYRALGSNGRQCVLKTLCQSAQTRHTPQGTFFDELTRAVFTLPKGQEFEVDHHKAYDEAHHSIDDCDTLYPDCTNVTLDPTMSKFSY